MIVAVKPEPSEKRSIIRFSCSLPRVPRKIVDLSRPKFEVESFKSGSDESRFIKLNNTIFVGHPDQGDWNMDRLLSKMSEPWFRADQLFFMVQGGVDIGLLWLKEHKLIDRRVCEIYVIGIHPQYQGKSIGKAVMELALNQMSADGFAEAWVYTDRSNEKAIGLYRSLAFDTDLIEEV
ncbi:MAG: GNAT family N-acetyltransferase [Actinobacteria bacterium]|nr:GNAT family N-acetyltransferase [Actinomycetota bacterium]